MRRAPRATVLAVVSVALAAVASVGLAVWPCSYSTQSSDGAGGCASILDVNGTRVLVILAVPVVLTAAAVVAARLGIRWFVIAIASAYVVLCVLALASIGLFYLPSVIALLAAAFTTPARSVPVVAPGSG
jgi:hypothetical protein